MDGHSLGAALVACVCVYVIDQWVGFHRRGRALEAGVPYAFLMMELWNRRT